MHAQTGAIRVLDCLLAISALTVLAAPMLAIGLAIRMADGGPALFRQQRVGQGCRIFTVLKFRSMRVDSDGLGAGTAREDEDLEAARARFQRTEAGDPRITRLGAILRPSHLDELPQLLNIFRGDMSFVGVRPDTPVQQGDYTPEYWELRHRLRPGLTGPAQLRTEPLTFDQRSDEELKWLNGPGVRSYISILVRTIFKAIRRSSF